MQPPSKHALTQNPLRAITGYTLPRPNVQGRTLGRRNRDRRIDTAESRRRRGELGAEGPQENGDRGGRRYGDRLRLDVALRPQQLAQVDLAAGEGDELFG